MARLKKGVAITAAACLLLSCINVRGQQQAELSLNQIREQVRQLALVDADPSIPAEVKVLNHQFLEQRRAQLKVELNKRIGALQNYLSKVGPALSADEIRLVQNSIRELEDELRATPGRAQAAAVADSSPSVAAVGQSVGRAEPPANLAVNVARVGPATPAPLLQPATGSEGDARSDVLLPLKNLRSCADVSVLVTRTPDPTSVLEKQFCAAVDAIQKDKTVGNPRTVPAIPANPQAGLNLRRDFYMLGFALSAIAGRSDYITKAEEARVDKQVGAGSSGAGSTSLVSKGGVPSILGFAVENGALEKTVSDTTITFRTNPVGLAKALANQGFVESYDQDDAFSRLLRRTSVAVSFDTSRGKETGVFTGDKQQVSSYSVRAELYNKRDPRDKRYKQDWQNFLTTNGEALVGQIQDLLTALVDFPSDGTTPKWKDKALQEWFDDTNQELGKANASQVETVFKARLAELPTDLSPEAVTQITSFEASLVNYLSKREALLDRIAQGGILTFEYVGERKVNAPDISKFMLIGETAAGRRADLTGNVSFSLFNRRPTGTDMGRVRDAAAAAQLDVPLGDLLGTGAGKFVFSLAFDFKHMMEDAVADDGTVVPNTKGNLGLFQAKLTVPVKGSGVKIPISFTYANRTELLKEKEVRGNIGFTFDLDTIFSKFKP